MTAPAAVNLNAAVLPQNPGFKRQLKWLVQGIPVVEGGTTQAQNLPTDLPLSALVFRIYGAPVGEGGTAATLNAPFGVDASSNPIIPAIANLLGLVTVIGKPQDGSDGLNVNNIPGGQIALDSFLMNGKVVSTNIDFNVDTPTDPVDFTTFLHFEDVRLPMNSFLTALEAMRYGDDKDLQVKVKFGSLNDATLDPDLSVSVGGTYETPLGVGTLVLDIGYIQLVPTNFTWPAWNGPNPLPTMDRDFEYLNSLDITQSQGQNFTLSRRRIQSNTIFQLTEVLESGVEQGYNNLGVAPQPFLQQKLGGQILDQPDPYQMQGFAEIDTLYGNLGIPAGIYFWNDWADSLSNLVSLLTAKGTHAWDTDPGPNADEQNLRCLHITYNPSAALFNFNKNL